MATKVCEACGQEYESKYKVGSFNFVKQKYCSPECARKKVQIKIK